MTVSPALQEGFPNSQRLAFTEGVPKAYPKGFLDPGDCVSPPEDRRRERLSSHRVKAQSSVWVG